MSEYNEEQINEKFKVIYVDILIKSDKGGMRGERRVHVQNL